jgi:hypothetical protein
MRRIAANPPRNELDDGAERKAEAIALHGDAS